MWPNAQEDVYGCELKWLKKMYSIRMAQAQVIGCVCTVCRVRSQHRRLSRTLLMATTPSTRQGPRLALGSSQSKWVGEPDYLDPLLGARLTYLVFRRDQRVVPCHEPFIPVIVIIIAHLAMNSKSNISFGTSGHANVSPLLKIPTGVIPHFFQNSPPRSRLKPVFN